ncbi:MucR family transcriptional regulator, partial [Methylobacterium sp. J-076]|uniref:MucR family transcriptional regulator n=1 Tax=Methylobacterium sp. J-076 TaxID=2836655 RepID=UPI001FBA8017
FLDGKPYKTLKRHLRSHGLDPAAYRERYGLPLDYPMVASNYSAQRSELSSRRQIMAQGSSADQVAE